MCDCCTVSESHLQTNVLGWFSASSHTVFDLLSSCYKQSNSCFKQVNSCLIICPSKENVCAFVFVLCVLHCSCNFLLVSCYQVSQCLHGGYTVSAAAVKRMLQLCSKCATEFRAGMTCCFKLANAQPLSATHSHCEYKLKHRRTGRLWT